jgi:hypothetical protein
VYMQYSSEELGCKQYSDVRKYHCFTCFFGMQQQHASEVTAAPERCVVLVTADVCVGGYRLFTGMTADALMHCTSVWCAGCLHKPDTPVSACKMAVWVPLASDDAVLSSPVCYQTQFAYSRHSCRVLSCACTDHAWVMYAGVVGPTTFIASQRTASVCW